MQACVLYSWPQDDWRLVAAHSNGGLRGTTCNMSYGPGSACHTVQDMQHSNQLCPWVHQVCYWPSFGSEGLPAPPLVLLAT